MSQPSFNFEKTQRQRLMERDDALNLIERNRALLVQEGKRIAEEIARRTGSVTSNRVFQELVNRGYGELLEAVDRRFMGAVFRKGFERVGYINQGSHGRPQSIWRLK